MMGFGDNQKESTINATAILLIIAIIAGLAIFVVLNFKRSDYILKLEKEIDKLKDNKNNL
ncbi:hypothetical protein A2V49_01980 [candidate division WWE3 bacterium RBG_19FT_COMBO_34_6]|uniref:Uncharacterized protein n=1 Tax=candidate division WWE3 bacterium RBG_19FT_COMBO_34_6 TaxID=1802612 RepID=A0A1F4UM14_UNCKA|nr:MAG: hypothetical protein A2V49_01980 [candidate division WWE3 bacterium RBG_19FT_COMBO_34_6]